MSFELLFWILMLIWLLFGLAPYFGWTNTYLPLGNTVLLFILFLLLGWRVFGTPVHP